VGKFLEVRAGGLTEAKGRGLGGHCMGRLGGLKINSHREFWVRLVSSGGFKSTR
jgi:hypothetical protein